MNMRRIYFVILLLALVTVFFSLGLYTGNHHPPEELLYRVNSIVTDLGNGILERVHSPEQGLEDDYADTDNTEPEDSASGNEDVEEIEDVVEKDPGPDLRTVNMAVAGDITAHIPQIEQAYTGDGKYDFSPSFEIISPYLQSADLTIGDLETSQAGPEIRSVAWGVTGYTGFPEFNAPQELSVALAEAGFNLFTMANNHTMDRGYEGLMITLEHVRSLGIKTFGAYMSAEERDTPLIVDQDGIKIAFIGYTYSLNGIPVPAGHEYCVNHVPEFEDINPVLTDIKRARENGADLVAVFPHWGGMYVSEPNPARLREVAAEMAAAGADLIMGGHPHFIQPIEWFFNEQENGNERAALGIYSLGNFISNQHYPHNPSPFVEYGILLDLELTKNMDSGEAWISGVDYEITWVHRNWRHRILPLSEVFAGNPQDYNLSQAQVEELQVWHQRNVEVVEMYGHSEDMARAMEISRMLLDKAHDNSY